MPEADGGIPTGRATEGSEPRYATKQQRCTGPAGVSRVRNYGGRQRGCGRTASKQGRDNERADDVNVRSGVVNMYTRAMAGVEKNGRFLKRGGEKLARLEEGDGVEGQVWVLTLGCLGEQRARLQSRSRKKSPWIS